MAIAKRGSIRDDTREYRLVCAGLSKEELFGLYYALQAEVDARAGFRNPFPLQFGPHTVHEILLISGPIAGAVGTKVLDLITAIVKRKLEESDAGKGSVTIYDHSGRPSVVVETKPPKRRR